MIDEHEKRLDVLKEHLESMQEEELGEDMRDSKGLQIDMAVEASQKPIMATEKEIGEEADRPEGPVGIDIGTTHIAVAQNKRKHIDLVKQLNAFFTVPRSKFTRKILKENDVTFFEQDGLFYIIGFSAEDFANMFAANTRRPMERGLLSPNEPQAIEVIHAIINTLIQKPRNFGETICFSVPGEPIGGTGSVVYHESVITQILGGLGYSPVAINEGLAVVMSELVDEAFTGIGISMGGGMCNVCLAYLSVPVVTYGFQKAGDYIDSMAGMSVGEAATKMKAIKEWGLDLLNVPKDRIIMALHIFYEELIFSLVESLRKVLSATDKIPKISRPIPIVLSGGTAMAAGVKEKFENALKKVRLPVAISSVRMADDPLHTTAKGALIKAMSEGE